MWQSFFLKHTFRVIGHWWMNRAPAVDQTERTQTTPTVKCINHCFKAFTLLTRMTSRHQAFRDPPRDSFVPGGGDEAEGWSVPPSLCFVHSCRTALSMFTVRASGSRYSYWDPN